MPLVSPQTEPGAVAGYWHGAERIVLAEARGKEDREGAQHYAASAFWALTAVEVATGIRGAGKEGI